ncbi:xylan O-acetyltransferase 2-like [Lolium rigidum]|uniref:xylan O-acetyltransferase 2-like n=1 Tax=Lolium rigidum TaxID=89674 RepID=UPI001F5DAB7F|nr:xylan O-acetyltransferase 2-like [Lolium rigidum]
MQFAGRRKSSLVGAGAGAGAGQFDPFGTSKHGASLRKGGRLPVYVAGVFFFVFVIVMYGEDIRSVTLDPIALAGPATTLPAAVFPGGGVAPRRDVLSSTEKKGADEAVTTTLPRRDLESPVERGELTTTTTTTETTAPAQGIRKLGGETSKKPKKEKKKKAKRQRAAKKTVAPALAGVTISTPETCDLSKGEWVFDNASYPLYREEECSFLTSQVTCMRNGRRDDNYQKWRWQPSGCDMPRFDSKLFMERLRNKRLMFVGDSLNRNQWESMVCLVQSAVSPDKKYVTWEDQRVVFHAWEFNATVEFYWSPFLVESNSDNPKIHSIQHRIIDADSIAAHAENWRRADYLVFNTYIWWMNTLNMKLRRPAAGQNWEEHDEVVRIDAYRKVLTTWAGWVNENIDPARTSVFFMSMSPLHLSPQVWGNPDGIRCAKETMPLLNWNGPIWLGTDWDMFKVASNVSREASPRVPITFVDITTMSERRKDGHTSVHTIRQGALLTPEQQADPGTYADCIHWCLPGVPDIWNSILYTRIMSRPEAARVTAS